MTIYHEMLKTLDEQHRAANKQLNDLDNMKALLQESAKDQELGNKSINLLATIAANVNNKRLSDEEFRQFVRNSMSCLT